MIKKIIIVISIFMMSIVVVGCLFMEYYYWNIWSNNHWAIHVKAPLQKNRLKIYHCNTVNCPININSWKLDELNEHSSVMMVFDGKTLINIRPEYGENDFYVVYNDRYALEFRQFKTNRNYLHDYQFTIWQNYDSSVPMVKVDIQGTNYVHFESKMFEI